MSVTLTPLTADPGSYLVPSEARTLGALLPAADLAALLAKSDAELAVLLFAASMDIDAAMPYQGVKYEADQAREFPRFQRAGFGDRENQQSATGAWDLDPTSGAAVVPRQVKLACLHQAASLLDVASRDRLEAIHGGLAAQSTGSMSETYLKPSDLPGGLTGLCRQAGALMGRYRLRSAPLL